MASRSPNPSNLLMKLLGENFSKSKKCSPVPMKIIGLYVAATALKAPPPLAWPSSLVTITDPIETASLNALAWSKQAYPMELSITKITSCGLIVFSIYFISWNKEPSYLCLPLVSTIIRSNFSFLNFKTPSFAIFTGSVSV